MLIAVIEIITDGLYQPTMNVRRWKGWKPARRNFKESRDLPEEPPALLHPNMVLEYCKRLDLSPANSSKNE